MEVADLKADTESEKSDNSSKTNDFITGNGKKFGLMSCSKTSKLCYSVHPDHSFGQLKRELNNHLT